MRPIFSWRAALSLMFILLSVWSQPALSAAFTPGNVVIFRVGDGSRALASTGNPVFLDEYRPGVGLVQSIPMPKVGNGAHAPFAGGGTAASEGWLTRSQDKRCLLVPGYGRDPSITSGNLVSAIGVSRVVGVVTRAGEIDTSTTLIDLASGANNFRGAASTDCATLWVTSSLDGTRTTTIGAISSTSVSVTPAGGRAVAVVDGQLYISSNTGNNTYKGVNRVGSGTPTSSTSSTRLPGLTDALTPSPYAFVFADLNATPGSDTLYIADDTKGVTKFSLESGSWVAKGTVGAASDAYQGLTATVSGTTVTLYATRGTNQLVSIVDSSGYGGQFVATPVEIATAGTNQAFRGVALAPEVSVTANASAGPNGTITPPSRTVFYGETTTFNVSPNPGYTAVVGGSCGGTMAGGSYTTQALTADCSVSVTFTQQVTHTVTPSAGTGGSITPALPLTVIAGSTATFAVEPQAGYVASVGGTCGGTLSGTTYTTSAVSGNCSVAASFALQNFTVAPSAGVNGSINPATPQVRNYGSTAVFTVVPQAGYSASVGGTCGGALVGTTYTTNAITGNCTVTASFPALPVFSVTPTSKGHGSVMAATPQNVVQGQTASFTVTPDAGYAVAVRGTCGGQLQGNIYTTKPITQSCTVDVSFAKKVILFLGNSYTFGRIDPVMSYNTDNVTDLTMAMWQRDATGSNPDEPHPWGGIPGVFKKLSDQAGLDYDVSISARNAASLRGHFLNSNPAGWDLRGNAASQKWTTVVLQDLSDEPLPPGRSHNANLPYFNAYADKFQKWIHEGAGGSFTETQLFGANCSTITGASQATCDAQRNVPESNLNANSQADIYLYQTWARPDLIAPNGSNVNGTTYAANEGLELMTADFHAGYFGRAAANPGFKGVSPVGDAFLRAVATGVAMRDPYVPDASKLNLWYTDYFHPSKYGSYLSALVHFGRISGIDPTSLGAGELAAVDLGISAAHAVALQQVAKATLVPAAPTISAVTGGDGQVEVEFTPANNLGHLDILEYIATCGARSVSTAASPVVVSGLVNGVSVNCTVSARNSVGTGEPSSASINITPVGAQCGSAQGVATAILPRTNLCAVGAASSVVSSTGVYSWSCQVGNAQPAACSANWAATPMSSGTATADVAPSWVFRSAQFIAASTVSTPLRNVSFPHGLFDFVLEGGAPGSTAELTITYSTELPAGATYWKFGPSPIGHGCSSTAACAAPHWYAFPDAVIEGNTVRLRITDGGLGDDDLTANGVIVDAGGPGYLDTAAMDSVVPVPTLSQWTLFLMAGLFALFGWVRLARAYNVRSS
ncbi:IPTL-CTERM sorting domain-containing protein [Ottowia thiooxydans]|uniref:IPTL-CTERM sorting domain-containing protein n=1 Tax=Ottowia thiooxydans TaxID=219182 RepID=UPI0004015DAB|nr:IPTL-CTERM sorting domain-containing protein [Ottowia thiooxydans]